MKVLFFTSRYLEIISDSRTPRKIYEYISNVSMKSRNSF